jgi:hypothetical protein
VGEKPFITGNLSSGPSQPSTILVLALAQPGSEHDGFTSIGEHRVRLACPVSSTVLNRSLSIGRAHQDPLKLF